MKKILVKSLLKSAAILTLSAASVMSYADAKQDLTEARQETQIWTTYALSPYLRAQDISVKVNNGKAVLTGKVDDDVNKDLAKEIALGVSGIKDVDNQIVVQSDYVPKKDRSYGDDIDDITIAAAVKSKMVWSKHSFSSAKVQSKNGRVALTGTVESAAAKMAATQIATNTKGVVAVSNQLTVDAKANSKNVMSSTSKNVADAWVTTKVKSSFFYSSNVSGSDIEVSTNAGVVTLKGKVGSGAERALAIEIAENVRGVKSVNAKQLVF